MAMIRETVVTSRSARIVLALTAAMSICAAMAAVPSAPAIKAQVSVGKSLVAKPPALNPAKTNIGDDKNGVRPLGRGSAIMVARAYGVEDEDCSFVVTQSTDAVGDVQNTRRVSCVD